MAPSEVTQEDIEEWRSSFKMSRRVQILALLAFVLMGMFSAKELYYVIWVETHVMRQYFSWIGFNKLLPLWPGLAASGFVYYVCRSISEHYEGKLADYGQRP